MATEAEIRERAQRLIQANERGELPDEELAPLLRRARQMIEEQKQASPAQAPAQDPELAQRVEQRSLINRLGEEEFEKQTGRSAEETRREIARFFSGQVERPQSLPERIQKGIETAGQVGAAVSPIPIPGFLPGAEKFTRQGLIQTALEAKDKPLRRAEELAASVSGEGVQEKIPGSLEALQESFQVEPDPDLPAAVGIPMFAGKVAGAALLGRDNIPGFRDAGILTEQAKEALGPEAAKKIETGATVTEVLAGFLPLGSSAQKATSRVIKTLQKDGIEGLTRFTPERVQAEVLEYAAFKGEKGVVKLLQDVPPKQKSVAFTILKNQADNARTFIEAMPGGRGVIAASRALQEDASNIASATRDFIDKFFGGRILARKFGRFGEEAEQLIQAQTIEEMKNVGLLESRLLPRLNATFRGVRRKKSKLKVEKDLRDALFGQAEFASPEAQRVGRVVKQEIKRFLDAGGEVTDLGVIAIKEAPEGQFQNVLIRNLSGAWKKLAQRNHWGPVVPDKGQITRGDLHAKFLELGRRASQEGLDGNEFKQLVLRFSGQEKFGRIESAATRAIRDAVVVSSMSRSAVSQFGNLATSLLVSRASLGEATIALAQSMSAKSMLRAQRAGLLRKNLVSLAADPNLGELARKFLRTVGTIRADQLTKSFAVRSGEVASERLVRNLAKQLRKGKSWDQLNGLQREILTGHFNINGDDVAAMNRARNAVLRGSLLPSDRQIIGSNMLLKTQPISPLDRSFYAHGTWGSLTTQFKTSIVKEGKATLKGIKEAAKQGDYVHLMRWAVAAQALGFTINETKRLLSGKEPPDSMVWRLLDGWGQIAAAVPLDLMMGPRFGDGGTLGIFVGPAISKTARGLSHLWAGDFGKTLDSAITPPIEPEVLTGAEETAFSPSRTIFTGEGR